MKKIIIVAVLVCMMVFGLALTQRTTATAKVVDFEDDGKTVVFEAFDNLWLWDLEEGESFAINENVKLRFYTKGLDHDFSVWEIEKVSKIKS